MLTIPDLALGSLFVFLAAIVRGYSGFGFSLLVITSLSLLMPPQTFIPAVFMLEIAASLHMLPGIWKDIHWRSLAPLIVGCLVGTPLGVWLLTNVPAPPMQIALAVFVLIITGFMWRGFTLKSMPGMTASAGVGVASGLFNGAFGIGGPPVILFYFASPAGNIAGRASLIAFFLMTDLIGLAFMSQESLIGWNSLYLAFIFLPALFIGIWLGAKSFKGADPRVFRKWVLALLAFLAVLSGLQGIAAYW
ncbi:sulfite exporter TauE/SafE family protein [Nordella sp. HKS 07]|uniref:sulfite exporter TauE/SafE family protein n=1 Tax=Nordella sp. HKS 07 TaxID=2712222 RepID=UPI0013E16B86|nr:sulfite exporter TauE/SafE family protein [Nordella sp. HKS 07]QIG51502.1 sulfite exporter TauE/SafE family protein [Nordella sp. HKS 07]